MKYTPLNFISTQLSKVPPVPTTDLTGKVVVVTGSGVGGMGYEAAKHFSTMNPAKIIIAVRSQQRGQETVDKLREETGYAKAEVAVLDLSSFSSVVAFGNKMAEQDRLDILVANAAVAYFEGSRFTADGWEEMLQVNVVSTFLSIILLLPLMQRTARLYGTEPRITVVGSGMHYYTKLENELTDGDAPLRSLSSADSKWSTRSQMKDRYSVTKLLDLFMARALSEAVASTPIVVNNVCPGYCYSGLRRDAGILDAIFFRILELLFARTTDEGSRQLVWAALASVEGEDMRGAYIDSMKIAEPSDYSISKDGLVAQRKLWDDLVKELTRIDPRVPDILEGLKD